MPKRSAISTNVPYTYGSRFLILVQSHQNLTNHEVKIKESHESFNVLAVWGKTFEAKLALIRK